MPAFDYEAVDNSGRALSGQVSAKSEKDALRTLQNRGLTPTSVAHNRPKSESIPLVALGRSGTAKDQDRILLVKQLALLLNAGVPLIAAVDTLTSQSPHPTLTRPLEALARELRSGAVFSSSLEKAIPALPGYVFQLCAAGESIGELGPALSDAARQMEYDYRIKQDIKNALTYPAILVAAGLGAVIFIFLIVVPRFSAMLATSGGDLPFLSRLVLSTGVVMSDNKTTLLLGLLLLGLTSIWVGRQETVRDSFRQVMFRLPLVGGWLKEAELAKWSSMLGTLLNHGVDLIKALEFSRATISIRSLNSRMEQITKLVRGGRSLSYAMEEQDTFSDTALSLVQVGEESGELPQMLQSLATLYEESGRQRMKRFLIILEPAAIILIGIVIGGIVTAIMLAITSINQISL